MGMRAFLPTRPRYHEHWHILHRCLVCRSSGPAKRRGEEAIPCKRAEENSGKCVRIVILETVPRSRWLSGSVAIPQGRFSFWMGAWSSPEENSLRSFNQARPPIWKGKKQSACRDNTRSCWLLDTRPEKVTLA